MKELVLSLTKKDFEVQTFRTGGPGGQKQNKTSSGVRIVHKASGASGESRTERSQYANKKAAFLRLSQDRVFQNWLKIEIAIKTNQMIEIEQKIEEELRPEDIKTEIIINGKWVEVKDEELLSREY